MSGEVQVEGNKLRISAFAIHIITTGSLRMDLRGDLEILQ